MVLKKLYIPVLRTKLASALEGLKQNWSNQLGWAIILLFYIEYKYQVCVRHGVNFMIDIMWGKINLSSIHYSVLASRVSGCLFGTLVHEKYIFWSELFENID